MQVSERAGLSPAQVTERLEAIAPKTIRGRSRTPGVLRRHVSLTVDGPVCEEWTLGYLIDTIYLRDLWMHRIDAARAAGQLPELTAGHDGRIVADITAEWARRHGQPFLLDLTGPAGGSYARDPASPAAEHLSLDAVEFCRTLAGRAPQLACSPPSSRSEAPSSTRAASPRLAAPSPLSFWPGANIRQ